MTERKTIAQGFEEQICRLKRNEFGRVGQYALDRIVMTMTEVGQRLPITEHGIDPAVGFIFDDRSEIVVYNPLQKRNCALAISFVCRS